MRVKHYIVTTLICILEGVFTAQADTLSLEAYGQYAYPLTDSLLRPLQQHYTTARDARDYAQLKEATGYLMNHYQQATMYNEAFSTVNDYLDAVVQSGDSTLIPTAYYYLGSTYFSVGVLDLSLEYFLKAASFPLSPKEQCRVLYAVAEVSRNLFDLSPATMDNYKRSEAIARQLNDSSRIATALFGQSQMYANSMGVCEYAGTTLRPGMRDSLEISTRLLTEALTYDPDDLIYQLGLGLNYAGLGNFEQALKYGKKGLEVSSLVPDLTPIGLNTMASILVCKGDYAEAIRLCEQAYTYAEAHDKKGDMESAADILYYAYKHQGQYKQALEAYDTRTRLKMASLESGKKINLAAMQVKFDIKQKEDQLLLEKVRSETYRRNFLITSAFCLIVLLLSLLLLYFYRKKQAAYRALVRKSRQWAAISDSQLLAKAPLPSPDSLPAEGDNSTEAYQTLMLQVHHLFHAQRIFTDPELTLSSLADRLNTNRSYLSDTINRSTGKNFSSYVNEYRVREAIRMLSNETCDKYSIDQISTFTGFSTRKTFYEAFQKVTGLSPAHFRKNRFVEA